MRFRTRRGICALVLLVVMFGILARTFVPTVTRQAAPRDNSAVVLTANSDEQLFARWAAEYRERGLYAKTPIPLTFNRAFSKHFTKARGNVEIDFSTARVAVSVDGLPALSDGAAYEVWLVENGPGPVTGSFEAKNGDRVINLGALPPAGSLATSVDARMLADFAADAAAVMRVFPNRQTEYVIGGRQSVRFKVGREATVTQQKSGRNLAFAGALRTRPRLAAIGVDTLFLSTLALTPAQNGGGNQQSKSIARGKDLFFNNIFGGNGRTCGTCHPANNNMTIDAQFIATLPNTDPLFVAEMNNPDLPDFDFVSPTTPAIEDSTLMRARGLILENINGFDIDPVTGDFVEEPFFRATPSLFNLQLTAPYGLSGNIANLQDFTTGAVVQHFTKSMARQAGVDFVLPTAAQLTDMETFLLSNTSPAKGNFSLPSGNQSKPEVRGKNLVLSIGCTSCHTSKVFSGGNFNTGVETQEDVLPPGMMSTPTTDTSFEHSGTFNAPQLFGLRKKQFFHTGVRGNKSPAELAADPLANLKDAVDFYRSASFANSPEGPSFPGFATLTDQQVSDIAAFLKAISGP
jgi:cytochrome c peroxidase